MSESRETGSRGKLRSAMKKGNTTGEKRDIIWNNQNRIREFKDNSMVGQNTVNSSRPSQPGPSFEAPPLWAFNPIGPGGTKLRVPGVKQTMPVVPKIPKNNTRRNRKWALARSFMGQQSQREAKAPPHTNFNAAAVGRQNQNEANLSQKEYEANPPPLVNTGEPWYKNVVPQYSGQNLPWPPSPRTKGGKYKTKRRAKRSSYKK